MIAVQNIYHYAIIFVSIHIRFWKYKFQLKNMKFIVKTVPFNLIYQHDEQDT